MPESQKPDPPLTTAEVARLFGADPRTVARWAKRNLIPHFRTPTNHLRYHPKDILPLVQAQEPPSDGGGEPPAPTQPDTTGCPPIR